MKSGTVSLKKNFIMNTLLSLSSFIFPLLTYPYVSRVLLSKGMGKVSFAISFIAYFNMIAQLGIPTYGIRACSKVRDDKKELSKTVHELLMINLVMCIFSYVCLTIIILAVPKIREEKVLYIIISLTIILSSLGMEWLYKGLEQYTYITIRSVFFKFIACGAIFLLVHTEQDYVVYGCLSIFASSASNILNFYHARKYICVRPFKEYNFKRHMSAVLFFFAMSCATTVYTNLDIVMLGFMTSDIDVGYYNAAVKIKAILVSIVTSLGTVVLPRASYYIDKKMMDEFWTVIKNSLNFVLLLATPLMVYFILFARPGIYLLSGSAYEGSVVPMQIIMPTLLLIGITNVLGIQILIPSGGEKYVLYSEIIGAFIDFLLNMILIPKIAASGAAIGTLIAEIAVLLCQIYFLKEEIKNLFNGISFWKILLGVISAALASLWTFNLEVSNLFLMILSAGIFFITYSIVMVITRFPIPGLANKSIRFKNNGDGA